MIRKILEDEEKTTHIPADMKKRILEALLEFMKKDFNRKGKR